MSQKKDARRPRSNFRVEQVKFGVHGVASKHLFSAREMSSTLQHRLAEGQNGIAIQSKSEGGEPNRYT